MSKAGNVLRRSGVVLKSLGSSHSDLQLLINQLKETRLERCESNYFRDASFLRVVYKLRTPFFRFSYPSLPSVMPLCPKQTWCNVKAHIPPSQGWHQVA